MSQTFAQLINGKSATVEFSAGSASTPAVSFSGDTNTGIYSPGANQVAISTNGSGRLYVDASGNVGINKFALSQTFHVLSASGGTTARFENSSTGNFIDFFETGGGTRMGYIGHVTATGMFVHNDKNGPIVFDTNNTERMRLDSSGRLGLGTSSPSYTLDVSGTARITSVSPLFLGTTAGDSYIQYGANATTTNNWTVGSQADGTFRFFNGTYASGTERLRITSAGNVGIGITAPSELLSLNSSSSNAAVSIRTGGASFNSVVKFNADDTNYAGIGLENTALVMRCSNSSTPTERARIDSSGRLLVGTSSAATGTDSQYSLIHVYGNTSGNFQGGRINIGRAEFSANITAGEILGDIYFSDAQSGTYGRIECVADGTAGANDYPGRLVFSTTADGASSPTERMRINNGGATGFFNAGDTVWSASSTGSGTAQAIYVGSHSGAGVYGGTVSYKVFTNGNVQNTNGSYTTLSDAKLKENIVDAHSQWNDLKAIQIRNWNFKEETGHETHRQIGPIAQELEQVCPGLVFETPDRDEDGNETGEVTKGVNQSILYMKAVKALQEAMERIEQLETSNADLLARVTALEGA